MIENITTSVYYLIIHLRIASLGELYKSLQWVFASSGFGEFILTNCLCIIGIEKFR